jgi:hypothetical protein
MKKTRKAAAKKKKPAATAAAEEAFRRASVIRGDAVRTKDGTLPPGATFEIERVDESGTPVIKRRRFSIG